MFPFSILIPTYQRRQKLERVLETLFQQEGIEESGEKVKLLSPEGEIVEIDSAYIKPVPDKMNTVTANLREGIPGRKFVMVIDLARCKNLRKCHDACENMHHLSPEKEFLKVLKFEGDEFTSPYWQPTMCFHCDHPPCVKVCPVDAIVGAAKKMHTVILDACTGCDLCIPACPVDCIITIPTPLPSFINRHEKPELQTLITQAQQW